VTPPMFFIGIAIVLLLACFAGLFWRLASRFDAQHCTAEWLDRFSIKSYAPMERLLEKSDLAFLAAQPGYHPKVGKRLMAERREIFRAYLRLLVRDFNQLIGIGKLMVVYSNRDQREFARSLNRQQVRFYARVCALQLQLALHPLGWWSVDARGLLAALGEMQTKVQQLSSRPGPAVAQWA
jgi:hypothetical protein